MGIASTFGQAFAKATMAAGDKVPLTGTVFLSLADVDKAELLPLAKELVDLKFHLIATRGTAAALEAAGLPCQAVYKVNEGRPNIVDYVKNSEIDLIINTPMGRTSRYDERAIRMAALEFNIPCITTPAAAKAAVRGIRALADEEFSVCPVQEWYSLPKPLKL
jgi:carbamoyl-phosphate synthase large subunit